MWLKRLTLTFITVAVAAMLVSGQDPVILGKNNPGPVRIPLGSPLNLKCNLSTPEKDRFWVSWYHNPSGPSFSEEQEIVRGKVEANLKHDKEDTNDTLMLHVTPNAAKENHGWYFCSVRREIPQLLLEESNGTEVVISKNVESATPSSPHIVMDTQVSTFPTDSGRLMYCQHWVMVSVSAFILIILLDFSC